MNRVTVIGAGAWGTALAIQAHRAGRIVTLVARHPAAIDAARASPRLPGIRLPDAVTVSDTAPTDAGLLLWAVPTQSLRQSLTPVRAPVILCAKGVERHTNFLPLEILRDAGISAPAAVLSGPNFAREVAQGLPAAAVIASTDPALREAARTALGSPAFRLYTSDDPLGVQLGGAAKNVIAIAAGAVTGAGLGENARAALVTRGLAELSRLVVAAGGRAETVAGLSGLGDLLLTCTGPSSRNFGLGHALGTGRSLAEALAASQGVAEGVATAEGLLARAQGVDLPICQAVAAVLSGRLPLEAAIRQLLARPQRDE
jgi:glycerol-3-phosphate dehydrogenase (NAD(P)+)